MMGSAWICPCWRNNHHQSIQIGVCRAVANFSVIARPVRTLVVAIPRIEGKCAEKHPEVWDSLQFLVGIVTWFLSTGGLPHQSADWFAMTDSFGRAATNTNLSSHSPFQKRRAVCFFPKRRRGVMILENTLHGLLCPGFSSRISFRAASMVFSRTSSRLPVK